MLTKPSNKYTEVIPTLNLDLQQHSVGTEDKNNGNGTMGNLALSAKTSLILPTMFSVSIKRSPG